MFGQYYKDTKGRKIVSWFSFIVTPYKACGLSCCNPNGANGIAKKPVLMKRSQTKSFARHSMLLQPNSPSGPNMPSSPFNRLNDSFDAGSFNGNSTVRGALS